jgi:transposase
MFGLSGQQRYFLFPQAVDMRKSFDGLSGIVTQQMGKEVCSGDVYIFLGRDLSRIKLLVWEEGGFVLYYKRLEAGTFALPQSGQGSITLSYSELCLLIEGVEVQVTRRRKRFHRPAAPATAGLPATGSRQTGAALHTKEKA